MRDTSTFDSGEAKNFEETNGLVAVEAKNFAAQTQTETRKWYVISASQNLEVSSDGDESHADSTIGVAYLEVLPDTRGNHSDKTNSGGKLLQRTG